MKRGKLKLLGFNNLTKTLSFNMYDICYASTETERKKYISLYAKGMLSEKDLEKELKKLLTKVYEHMYQDNDKCEK